MEKRKLHPDSGKELLLLKVFSMGVNGQSMVPAKSHHAGKIFWQLGQYLMVFTGAEAFDRNK